MTFSPRPRACRGPSTTDLTTSGLYSLLLGPGACLLSTWHVPLKWPEFEYLMNLEGVRWWRWREGAVGDAAVLQMACCQVIHAHASTRRSTRWTGSTVEWSRLLLSPQMTHVQ